MKSIKSKVRIALAAIAVLSVATSLANNKATTVYINTAGQIVSQQWVATNCDGPTFECAREYKDNLLVAIYYQD